MEFLEEKLFFAFFGAITLLICFLLVVCGVGVLSCLGIVYPVDVTVAQEQFEKLAGTTDVEIVSYGFLNQDVAFVLTIDGYAVKGSCQRSMLNGAQVCSFEYINKIDVMYP